MRSHRFRLVNILQKYILQERTFGPEARRVGRMKLLLVRHAQSHNNVIQASVHSKIAKGELKPFEAQHEWLEQRQDDPGLTPAGHKQTAVLAKHVVKKVKKKAGGKCVHFPRVDSESPQAPLGLRARPCW